MRALITAATVLLTTLCAAAQPIESIVVTVRYKQLITAEVDAVVQDTVIFVDAQRISSLLMGRPPVKGATVTLDLGGDATPVEIPASDCLIVDSSIAIPLSWLSRIPGVQADLSFNDLTVRITSTTPLGIDVADDAWRRHLQRQNSDVTEDHSTLEVMQQRPLFGGSTLLYDITAITTPSGVSSSAQLALGSSVLGGELLLRTAVLSAPFRQPGVATNVLWSIGDPRGTLWTRISVGDLQWDRQWAQRMRGITLTNTPIGSPRFFALDTIEVDVDSGDVVDVFVNGDYTRSISADSVGHVLIPVTLQYGITTVGLEIFHIDGTTERKLLRSRVEDEAAPTGRLLYSASAGYDEPSQLAGTHLTLRYGLSNIITLLFADDAAGTSLHDFWHHMSVGMSARVGPASSISVLHTPGIVTEAYVAFSPSAFTELTAGYTLFGPAAWKNGHRVGARPPSEGTTAMGRIDATANRPWNIPITVHTSFTSMQRRDQTNHAVGCELTYNAPATTVSVRSRHETDGRSIASFTQAELTYRHLQTALLGDVLGGVRATASIETQWTKQRPVVRFAIEHQIPGRIVQPSFGLYLSSVMPASLVASATARFDEVLAMVQGRMSPSTVSSHTSVRGGIRLDDAAWDVEFDRLLRLSTSAVVLMCFEDLDHDGQHDDEERLLPEVEILHRAGRSRQHPNGGLLVTDLLPDAEYTFRIDVQHIPDPFLAVTSDEISVITEPNHTTLVWVPLLPASVIEGRIASAQPRSGLRVNIIDAAGRLRQTTTFSDGTFIMNGVLEGAYTVSVDGLPSVPVRVDVTATTVYVEV